MQKTLALGQTKGVGNIIIYPAHKKAEGSANNMKTVQTSTEAGATKTASEVVDGFGRHLSECGKSSKTIESYIGDVLGFIRHLEEVGAEFTGRMERFQVTGVKLFFDR